jgi:hypothetical protein
MTSTSEAAAVAAFRRLPDLVNGDCWLVHRGRTLTTECLIGIGAVSFDVSIASGRIAACEIGPRLMRCWSFAVRGTLPAWVGLWRRVPEPGWHDLFALTKRGEAVIEGDLRPLMAHLQYIKDVLAAPRRIFAEA